MAEPKRVHAMFLDLPQLQSFAKALWGERPPNKKWYEVLVDEVNGEKEKSWQYHLQQMVVAKDSIKYLKESM